MWPSGHFLCQNRLGQNITPTPQKNVLFFHSLCSQAREQICRMMYVEKSIVLLCPRQANTSPHKIIFADEPPQQVSGLLSPTWEMSGSEHLLAG